MKTGRMLTFNSKILPPLIVGTRGCTPCNDTIFHASRWQSDHLGCKNDVPLRCESRCTLKSSSCLKGFLGPKNGGYQMLPNHPPSFDQILVLKLKHIETHEPWDVLGITTRSHASHIPTTWSVEVLLLQNLCQGRWVLPLTFAAVKKAMSDTFVSYQLIS